jgi:hypothetical protein
MENLFILNKFIPYRDLAQNVLYISSIQKHTYMKKTTKALLTGLSLLVGGNAIAQSQEYKEATDNGDMHRNMYKKKVTLYSRDLISFAPFQFTENGVGTGLCWEHTLDKEGYLAFELPVVVTLNPSKSANNSGAGNDAMFYAMPGIKLYPTGLGKVKYAVGPSFVLATGQRSTEYYPYIYSSGNPYYENQSHSLFGIIVNNSLNLNPTARLHVGLDLGMGFTYIDKIGGVNQGMDFLIQGSFKIGYRF